MKFIERKSSYLYNPYYSQAPEQQPAVSLQPNPAFIGREGRSKGGRDSKMAGWEERDSPSPSYSPPPSLFSFMAQSVTHAHSISPYTHSLWHSPSPSKESFSLFLSLSHFLSFSLSLSSSLPLVERDTHTLVHLPF